MTSEPKLKRRIALWILATAAVVAVAIIYQASLAGAGAEEDVAEGQSQAPAPASCEQAATTDESVPGCPPPGESVDK